MKSRRLALILLAAAPAAALAGCASDTTPGGGSMESQEYVGATFASTEQGEPHIEFADDGTYSGSDGCNGIHGEYTAEGETLTLKPGFSTLKGCVDVDDWLRAAAEVQVDGDSLIVFDKSGSEIGTLTRS
ncbi:META domain-containing protein [Microbacterium karelineae]|uniref:META domain-containing protein n=1 Tax=Microbacterium karelineae TaxID=2654283 RepID=UPI0012EA5FE0|nr:META domain-containing protein [Microbacterium karelineae]